LNQYRQIYPFEYIKQWVAY